MVMLWRVILTLALLSLQSCAQPPQSPAPVPAPIIAAPAPQKKPPATPVAILVSEDTPAYSEVAKSLARKLGQRASIHYLTSSQLENIKTIARFKNEEHIQIVSIGLNASIAAKNLTNTQVVFCQVFNHQDYGLLTPRHKGVSMLPSLGKTFSTWRALSPGTKDIGIIIGPGFEDMIQTAKSAAKIHGFSLHHKTVTSDKEFQYAYKSMSKHVQGYWLLPDNRVLSENILREVMTFSVRNSKQVAVFSDELLMLGGLFSTSSDTQDIAQQVLERLDQAQTTDSMPGPDIAYLDKLNLRINSVMARNLGLKVPVQLRKYENAP
jgi:ABC-type uncharacterized transport system substrate-binding protein